MTARPRIAYASYSGMFFDVQTGEPTQLGLTLLRAVNAILDRVGGTSGRWLPLPVSTVAGLPATAPLGAMILCTDESGGAVPVFGDGTHWLRTTDRAIAS